MSTETKEDTSNGSPSKKRRLNSGDVEGLHKNGNGVHNEIGNLLKTITLDTESYVSLLRQLIGVVESLQNNPQQGLIPRENNASDILLERLSQYTTENGGPLIVRRIEYIQGRGNLIITYPGTDPTKTCAFVGSHLDVVPANAESWKVNPFELTIDGDKLYGRGTTDCLGHVALLTELMIALGKLKPKLKHSVSCVFIANEEASTIHGVGVDALVNNGELEQYKNGPIYWIDSADGQPCIGTAGMIQWRLKANGKLFHSGLPHRAINSIDLAFEALKVIENRFYEDFPACKQEEDYSFSIPSTLKATKVESDIGSLNQIPGHCMISGDVRLTPFYDVNDVRTKMEQYISDINANITQLQTTGPVSRYTLPDEDISGSIEIEWIFEGENGIACDLESNGHHALCEATEEVMGESKPFSICGSLPIVNFLKENNFDIQIAGYGLSARYHAENEYCQLTDMQRAFDIMTRVIVNLEGKL